MDEVKTYEPPALEPLTFTAAGKHPTVDISSGSTFDEELDIAALVAKYGSPLFVISESTIRHHYRAFLNAFTEPNIDTLVAYSYKTNYLPAVCAILHEEGAWAEIVSGMEYELARALGVPGKKIIFNGPYKTRDELETAFGQGTIVNVDNFDDLSLVEQVAKAIGKPCRIGIRVNFRYGPAPWTKFGFNNENGDCQRALERIAGNALLQLELLHNHSGTFLLQHETYARAADVLIDVAKEARELGLAPTIIDLGGGYPSGNRLKPIYDLPGGSSREGDFLFPYAEAICSRVARAAELFGGRPTLILEPGRTVIDAAVRLITTVVAKKAIPDQGEGIILDAGVNIVPTAYWYDHGIDRVTKSKNGEDKPQTTSIYGPLCMQIDVLREQAYMPPVDIGDNLIISNVGAYCHTMSMQFIQTRPATVLIGPSGPELIQRRETWRDVFARDTVPERLRCDDFAL